MISIQWQVGVPQIFYFNIPFQKIFIKTINYAINFASVTSIDAHWLKIQGRGYLMFLPKSLGGKGIQGKLPAGGPSFLGLIAFLLTSVLKFA